MTAVVRYVRAMQHVTEPYCVNPPWISPTNRARGPSAGSSGRSKCQRCDVRVKRISRRKLGKTCVDEQKARECNKHTLGFAVAQGLLPERITIGLFHEA